MEIMKIVLDFFAMLVEGAAERVALDDEEEGTEEEDEEEGRQAMRPDIHTFVVNHE